MGWWGYTHNLLWSHAYGVTVFILAKSMLNIVVMVLILLFAFLQWNGPHSTQDVRSSVIGANDRTNRK